MAPARARRYAQAIFELAGSEDDLEGWAHRIHSVSELFASAPAKLVLTNPILPRSERDEFVREAGRGSLDEQAMNLGRLLAATQAPEIASEVEQAYQELRDEAEGRLRAIAVAAIELPSEEQGRIAAQLSQRLGREVSLSVRVDPEVIGGLLIEIGDRVIDGTVAGRLQQLRRALATA